MLILLIMFFFSMVCKCRKSGTLPSMKLVCFYSDSPSLNSFFFFSSIVLPLSLCNALISLSEKPKSIFFVDQFLLVSSARIGKFQFQGFGK